MRCFKFAAAPRRLTLMKYCSLSAGSFGSQLLVESYFAKNGVVVNNSAVITNLTRRVTQWKSHPLVNLESILSMLRRDSEII